MKKRKLIYEMSLLAILIALLWLLDLTGIGYIPTGALSITILVFPVAVAAICLGIKGGLILGLMFGLTSFMLCVNGKDPVGAVLFAETPFLLAFVCIAPRMMMGLCVALVYKGLNKLLKGNIFATIIAGVSGTIFNTLFFLTFFWAFFNNSKNFFDVLMAALAYNFIIEIIVNTVISVFVSKVIYKFNKN